MLLAIKPWREDEVVVRMAVCETQQWDRWGLTLCRGCLVSAYVTCFACCCRDKALLDNNSVLFEHLLELFAAIHELCVEYDLINANCSVVKE